MSYGDAQSAAIDRARVRTLARGSAAMRGLRQAAVFKIERNPVGTLAMVVVGGLTTVSLAKVSKRAPSSIKRLWAGAIGLLRFEGALAVLRSLSSATAPRVAPATEGTAPGQPTPGPTA